MRRRSQISSIDVCWLRTSLHGTSPSRVSEVAGRVALARSLGTALLMLTESRGEHTLLHPALSALIATIAVSLEFTVHVHHGLPFPSMMRLMIRDTFAELIYTGIRSLK